MVNLSIETTATTLNYTQGIQYLMTASFNSLTPLPGEMITFVCFVPDTLSYSYHSPAYPVQSIYEVAVPNGTSIIYELDATICAGTSFGFDINATFNPTTEVGTQSQLTITVNEPSSTPITYEALPVTLVAVPEYLISVNTLLPNSAGGTSGNIFVMEVLIENIGDLGAPGTNFLIELVLPTQLTLNTSYPITGHDISEGGFIDTSADGITATTITPHSFTFAIPSYQGTQYSIRFKGTVASSLAVGQQYFINLSYTYDLNGQTLDQRVDVNIFHIQRPSPTGHIDLYTPSYSVLDVRNYATCSFSNIGNTSLINAVFTMNTSSNGVFPYVDLISFSTGTMSIAATAEPLSLSYTITLHSQKGRTFGPIPANTSTSITLQASNIPIPSDDHFITIVYTFTSAIPIGASFHHPISFIAHVNPLTPDPSYAYTNISLAYNAYPTGTGHTYDNSTTLLDSICMLYASAQEVSPNTSVLPGDTITYEFILDCKYSPLKQPAIAMILDKHLEYDNYVNYIYTDFSQTGVTFPQPVPQVIPNYNGSTSTILLISFAGIYDYTFNQNDIAKITLRFKVKDGSSGTINQQFLLGTITGGFVVYPECGTYIALQPNGSLRTLLATDIMSNTIEPATTLSSDLMVKGPLDICYLTYPNTASTYKGHSLYYRLLVTNVGNTDLTSLELVNIVPHINDTGVILTEIERFSKYHISPINIVNTTLSPVIADESPPTLTTYYSQSYDPIRFGLGLNQLIGTVDDWSLRLPEDITTIKAYKLIGTDFVLHPSQTLTIDMMSSAPENVATGLTAWNSFSAQSSYYDENGVLTTLFPIESEQGGVLITEAAPGIIDATVWSKGSLDTTYYKYPGVAHVYAGDTVYYKLSLTNISATNIGSLEGVIIMPHIGDTGVILNTLPRNSQYNIYPISSIEMILSPTFPDDPVPNYTIYYSQNYDPIRFGSALNETIGTVDDWTTIIPSDTSTIKAYKVVCTNLLLRPDQTLICNILATSPSKTTADLTAWNSFAVLFSYYNALGESIIALPVESQNGGVTITPSPTITLGGFVWLDTTYNGIYLGNEQGINDILVMLYNSNNERIQTTFTSPNADGKDGYYTFAGLPHDIYTLQFAPNTFSYAFTKQVLDTPNGSMPNSKTGITPSIDMTLSEENLQITAGLVSIRNTNRIIEVNKSVNKTLRSVVYSQLLLDMKLEEVIPLLNTKDIIP